MEPPLLCAIKSLESYSLGERADNNCVLVEDWLGRKLISFRGTDGIEDWLENLLFFGINVSYGVVQSLSEVFRFIPPHRGGYITTGHSKGGAMAILATQVLSSMGFYVEACYTFGSPRVYLFRSIPFKTKIVNYRHKNDWVTYLPPWRYNPGENILLPPTRRPHRIESYIATLERQYNILGGQ